MGLPVYINRPPHNVHLHAWGRASTGWWGCVSWRQRVQWSGGQDEVPFAAWVPAATLTQARAPQDGESVPRTTLDDDSRFWPVPPVGPCWYLGAWLDGSPRCPPGCTIVTGAAWRKKPRLAP